VSEIIDFFLIDLFEIESKFCKFRISAIIWLSETVKKFETLIFNFTSY